MARRKKNYSQPLTASQVVKLMNKARYGKTDKERETALQDLKSYNKSLTAKANKRMRELEKAGYTRWAYSRAVSYAETITGGTRFTNNINKYFSGAMEIEDIAQNIQEASYFLNSKSSTVKGNQEIDKSIVDAFRAKGINIKPQEEADFLDLISSDEWEMLKKGFVGSGQVLDDIRNITMSEKDRVDMDTLHLAFKNLVRGITASYDIALEELGHKI